MNKNIKIIIFSKDRPVQLNSLLESLYLKCEDIDVSDINVLYKESDNYSNAYNDLKNIFNNVKFIKENNFYIDIQKLTMFNSCDYTMFLVDDIIFKNSFSFKNIFKYFNEHNDLFTFSLRLGLNINYCYPLNSNQSINNYDYICNNIIGWKINEQQLDFAYPFSVDGNIFKSKQINEIIFSKNINPFNSPNKFESSLSMIKINDQFKMFSFDESILFNIPANRVQNEFLNRSEDVDPSYLLDTWNKGFKIDIYKIFNIKNNACHYPVTFDFINR